ncbi:hypothetical protein GM418_30835 [Maribellus comscasis]|uniref:Uncharacterized protein n=1 Tax=Maribellus comscasis TaxID=2681766 RepID=A0A6I6K8D0_9BACT|nr:hypothetical protein [Maribellus comscasis]QGY47893.1 hypothetical protein GM418_30835 [Maribellus comscasis]
MTFISILGYRKLSENLPSYSVEDTPLLYLLLNYWQAVAGEHLPNTFLRHCNSTKRHREMMGNEGILFLIKARLKGKS